jgi:hypothetical protein
MIEEIDDDDMEEKRKEREKKNIACIIIARSLSHLVMFVV